MPGRKFEKNGSITALTSFNCPGVSWAWPEANRHYRARLKRFHIDHAQGMMWFLQNHPLVPAAVRDEVKDLGLHTGEFPDDGHWPWQIYVRQGRRIEGREKVTQHHFTVDPATGRTPRVEHPIALGEHSFDIHPCHDRRFAVEGWMEGVLWYPKKDGGPAQPGQIAWGALLPKHVDNLLVPVDRPDRGPGGRRGARPAPRCRSTRPRPAAEETRDPDRACVSSGSIAPRRAAKRASTRALIAAPVRLLREASTPDRHRRGGECAEAASRSRPDRSRHPSEDRGGGLRCPP